MEKFLFYGNSTSDMTCIPARRLTEMDRSSSGEVQIKHHMPRNSTIGSNLEYLVALAVTAGKEEKVMNSISKAINSSKDPFIVVIDEISGSDQSAIDSDILSVSGLSGID